MRRREFLAATAAAPIAFLPSCRGTAPTRRDGFETAGTPDATLRDFAEVALEAARDAGASYADCRIADYRRQRLSAREARVSSIRDSEDMGFGVRVLVEGTWGFAASSALERDEMARVAKRAVAIARANARLQREPVELAPARVEVGVWNTPIRTDPFAVPLDRKIETMLEINAAALARPGVSFCRTSMDFVREHKLVATSEGTCVEQTLHRNAPTFTVTSVDRERSSFQSRNAYASPQGMGYEYVEDYPWLDDVRQAAEDVMEKHAAPSVEPGRYDLVLHPSHLWLTVHESIGHPTEYDRALGMEANYAGTSFLTPDKLGHYRVGSELVSFVAEKTADRSLATCAWDDDGVRTTDWDLVRDGVFVDYQVTRDQAPLLGRERSYGCSYAMSWRDVPFQRMPNVNLEPGRTPLSLDDLVADTEDGILIHGRGSYSIDHQRYNFQFGGQTYYRIRNGAVAGMLKDVAYQARTPDFWNACDAICDASEYRVGGSFYDGKGEPGQVNAVSHGCSPARFRKIAVLNTAREA
jgi:TldD protein